MPHLVFLCFTALLVFAAWRQAKKVQQAQPDEEIELISQSMAAENMPSVDWGSIPRVEPIGLNLGYKLVTLLDSQQGSPLTHRVKGVRQVISESCGILLPEIRIRENFRLKPAQYSIYINAVRIAVGEVYADKMMAIPSAELYGEIDGIMDTDPSYGLAVTWISAENKAKALGLGYQVVDCASVVATHVNKVARQKLAELFNYDDITHLNIRLSQLSPKLVEDLNASLNFSQLLRVYRQLLTEQVSLKDIVTIASTLLETSATTKDPFLLVADVRYALRHAIVNAINGEASDLAVYTLADALENILLGALNQSQQAAKISLDSFSVDPNILNQLQINMPLIYSQMKALGKTPVLLVTPQLRPLLSRYASLFASGLNVLSYNEIPDTTSLSVIGHL